MLSFYLQMIETPEDRSKFEVLYLEYKGLMYHVAYEILTNVEDAEDAVHQAFVNVAENIKKIDEAISPKTKSYLVTIVENRAIDIYRSKNRHEIVPLNDETMGMPVEYLGSFEVSHCFAQLTPRCREALILKYRHKYTNKEIGKMLNITELSAKKLVQRARAQLIQLCEGEGLV